MPQLFGDNEVIQGYRDLAIKVWVSARTYHAWIEIKFKEKTKGADKLQKVCPLLCLSMRGLSCITKRKLNLALLTDF